MSEHIEVQPAARPVRRRPLRENEKLRGMLKDILDATPPDQWRAVGERLFARVEAAFKLSDAKAASPIDQKARKAKIRVERAGKIRLVVAAPGKGKVQPWP